MKDGEWCVDLLRFEFRKWRLTKVDANIAFRRDEITRMIRKQILEGSFDHAEGFFGGYRRFLLFFLSPPPSSSSPSLLFLFLLLYARIVSSLSSFRFSSRSFSFFLSFLFSFPVYQPHLHPRDADTCNTGHQHDTAPFTMIIVIV